MLFIKKKSVLLIRIKFFFYITSYGPRGGKGIFKPMTFASRVIDPNQLCYPLGFVKLKLAYFAYYYYYYFFMI